MENTNQNVPWQPYEGRPDFASVTKPAVPTGKQELILGALTLAFSLLMCNCLLYAEPILDLPLVCWA